MNTTPDNIIKQIYQVQALIHCARQTVAATNIHDCDMAAVLLMEADSRLFGLKEAIDDPGPSMNPAMDGRTIADTISYATEADADPERVLRELVEVIGPYCQSQESREKLPDLLRAAGQEIEA